MGAVTPAVDVSGPTSLGDLFQSVEGRKVLTCIQCGVCAGTCPYGDVMDHPPRRIIAMLRSGMLEKVFSSESRLACVACYACMAKCPRGIRLTEVLLPLIKEQTLLRLPKLPAELQKALQNTLRYGNPMGESSRKRAAWVKTAGRPHPNHGRGPQGRRRALVRRVLRLLLPARGGCQPRHRQALPRAGHGLRDPRQRREVRRGMRPAHLTCSTEGFFQERHPKLAPVSTFTDGVFLAGCCQGPKDIPDTVAQAGAAAAEALVLIDAGHVELEPNTAYIVEEECSGCKTCIPLCPYSAISWHEEVKKAAVNEVLCKGCGTCVAACPSGSIGQNLFEAAEIFDEIEGVLAV
jgi:heterodisulfide reductase subunit C